MILWNASSCMFDKAFPRANISQWVYKIGMYCNSKHKVERSIKALEEIEQRPQVARTTQQCSLCSELKQWSYCIKWAVHGIIALLF